MLGRLLLARHAAAVTIRHLPPLTGSVPPGQAVPRRRGWAAITAGRLYYGGRIGAGSLHAHYAAQLLIGEGLVALTMGRL